MAVRSLSGGEALEAKLKELAQKIAKPRTLRVGFLENATYPDGTSVAMVAAIQEFGAPSRNIPPRPFFRSMIADKSPDWGKQLGGLVTGTNYDVDQALGQFGEGIKGQLQSSIIATNSPPLAPATIAAKGNAKPLVDTGNMLNSVNYQVKS